jgi:hypothetical protein
VAERQKGLAWRIVVLRTRSQRSGVRSDTRLLVDDAETSNVLESARDHLSVGVRFDNAVGSLWRVGSSTQSGRAHNPKVAGSNPAPDLNQRLNSSAVMLR